MSNEDFFRNFWPRFHFLSPLIIKKFQSDSDGKINCFTTPLALKTYRDDGGRYPTE